MSILIKCKTDTYIYDKFYNYIFFSNWYTLKQPFNYKTVGIFNQKIDELYIFLMTNNIHLEILNVYTYDTNFKCSEILNYCDKVYAQNIDLPYFKNLQLMPITLYQTPQIKPKLIKKHSIFISHFEISHPCREFLISTKRPRISYKEYINKLNDYEYSVCIRGNGLDTYRFWECIYLGVIPILLVDETSIKFVEYLKRYCKLKNIHFIIIHINK